MRVFIDDQWKAVGFKLIHMRTVHCIVSRAPSVPCKAGKNQALLKEKKEAAEAELARKKAWCYNKMVWECHELHVPKISGPYCSYCRLWQIY